jgi:hypothetical protein
LSPGKYLALAALYSGGVALIWYFLSHDWRYAAVAGVPLNLALGFLVGRWWAPLFAALGLLVVLPDEASVEGVPAWVFAWYLVVLPSVPLIVAGVVARAIAGRRRDLLH